MKLLITIILVCGRMWATACSGSSPTWTAASVSSTDVQACFNAALQCGDTVIVPSGSATWSTQVTLSPPTGCAANQGITVQGATTCTGGCAAGSGGSGLAFTDSTNITLNNSSGAFSITGAANTAFVTLTGFTFINGVAATHGQLGISGTHGQVSFRIHHIHFTDSLGTSGVMISASNGYGLIDHYRSDNTAASGETTPVNFGG